MQNGGKVAAAILVMEDVIANRQPVNMAVRDWSKKARYAGAKDRAWVSGLVLDALRRKNSVGHAMGVVDESRAARVLILGTLRFVWGWEMDEINEIFSQPHPPEPLSEVEEHNLSLPPEDDAPFHVQGDYPEWMTPYMVRVFGEENIVAETQAMAVRAQVDLRINTLKADAESMLSKLKSTKGVPSPLLKGAYHIPAPHPTQREASLMSIPAYSEGKVEVQDAGSQLAALAANAQPGENILDYCAGGGGKTLAMAAQMQNEGKIYAYDIDGRRLSGIFPRLARSGVNNVEICDPRGKKAMEALIGQMDCVFVDAPCTGTGTWRRKPDTKWRVSIRSLEKRSGEQANILQTASEFVKPGGRLLYATCSFLMEENEDQIAAFLERNPNFRAVSAIDSVLETGQLTAEGTAILKSGESQFGSVRLTPLTAGTDGFFFALLVRD